MKKPLFALALVTSVFAGNPCRSVDIKSDFGETIKSKTIFLGKLYTSGDAQLKVVFKSINNKFEMIVSHMEIGGNNFILPKGAVFSFAFENGEVLSIKSIEDATPTIDAIAINGSGFIKTYWPVRYELSQEQLKDLAVNKITKVRIVGLNKTGVNDITELQNNEIKSMVECMSCLDCE